MNLHLNPSKPVKDGVPATPPPDVLAAVAQAADAYDTLAQSGRLVHFELDPFTGRLVASLRDARGNHLGPLSARKVLEMACGGTLD